MKDDNDIIFEEHCGDIVRFHRSEKDNIIEVNSFYPVHGEIPIIERGIIKDSINPKVSLKGLEDIKKPSQFVKKIK